MRKTTQRRLQAPTLSQIALAASSVAALLALPAHAQTAPAAESKSEAATEEGAGKNDVGNLSRVVVTATSQKKSKMRSSVAVTDVDQEQVRDFGARTEAEVLLLIPGVRTESTAGPGGNANISVRGLPISSGGSKYVQLQEDGLPTVQFGDMNFSNNDYWTRFDNSVDSIQTLRGGSSSVFASHAPGAVINYISKTGKIAGGSIGLTKGLNFDETRVDGNYGNRLGSDLYFHVGGYFRQGEGNRHYSDNALQGYQLKGNITKEFNGGKGYVRLNFKMLDEHAPTTPQTFVNAKLSGKTVGSFKLTDGFDGTRDSQYSIYNATVPGIDPLTRQQFTSSLLEGITVKSKSVGFEFHNDLANGVSVDNKFRISSNAGAFQAQFWNVRTLADLLADTGLPGGATKVARYYNGPLGPRKDANGNALPGDIVTAANLKTGLVSNGAAINTQTPDMGNIVNDLSVSKQFIVDAAKLDVRGGLYMMTQNVKQRWMISERITEVGRDGAVIDLFDAAGNQLTTAGLTGYNNQWGCCARDIDAKFTTTAPYLSMNAQMGDLDLDAGVRQERFSASGSYAGGSAGAFDVNGDGTITGAETNTWLINPSAPRSPLDYKRNYTNYSLGANYRVTTDLSAFVHYSEGNRAISDRLLFSSNIDAITGQLTAGGRKAILAPVKQTEVGVKHRGSTSFGSYSVAATLYHTTNTEFDFDQTRQDDPTKPNYAGPKLNVLSYKSDGLELETGGTMGNFSLLANIVYNKEVITGDAGGSAIDNLPANVANPNYVKRSQVGKTSGGVPKWRYTISPRYAVNDDLVVGATLRGQGEVYTGNDNVNKIKGHFIVNAFVNYDFGGGLTGSLNVNNLLDKVYPASGGGFVGGSSTVFGAGVESGRTISASVRYAF